jgi:hypothetical protein
MEEIAMVVNLVDILWMGTANILQVTSESVNRCIINYENIQIRHF